MTVPVVERERSLRAKIAYKHKAVGTQVPRAH